MRHSVGHYKETKGKHKFIKVFVAIFMSFVVALTTYDFVAPSFAFEEETPQTQSTAQEYDANSDSDVAAPENEGEENAARSDKVGEDQDKDSDAKAEKTAINAKGKTYNVTVSYDEEAAIPEDAELQVEDIEDSADEYDEYMARTEDAVGKSKVVAFARFFDIKIMSGDEEVQPEAPVEVVIELTDNIRKEDVTAIHFKEDEQRGKKEKDVVLETEVAKADAKKMDSAVAFETDGFSVYAIATVEDDGLDGKSYGIVNNFNTVSGTAMMNQASGDTRLKGQTMTVRIDTADRTSTVYVAKDSNITMWKFSPVSGDQYYITTEVNGDTKYLSITSSAIKLVDEHDDSCLITVEQGTGKYNGKVRLRSGNQVLRLNGSNFERAAGANNDYAWMYLAKKSNLNDDDFVTYTAEKVSVSGKVNPDGTIDYDVKDGDEVVVYTRVWNEDTKQYDYYVIDYDGMLVRAYASGDSIAWVGSRNNTMLWDFTEYHKSDGTPNYYYELQNQYSGKYIAPQVTDGKILSDSTIGINLNGRRNKEYYTTILAWDDPYYDYASLKVKDLNLTSAPISKADTFYFAVMKKEETQDKLTEVSTVDHKPYGITIKMQDYGDVTIGSSYRSKEMSAVIGDTAFSPSSVTADLLTKNINGDYPTATNTNKSLGKLFNESIEVNHQFLTGTYKETGYFEYDSTQNFAHLVSSTDDKWYGKPRPDGGAYGIGDFVVYEQLGTTDERNKDTLKHGQFLPYNDLEEGEFSSIYTNEMDIHTSTQKAVPLSSLDPRKGEKLYNIHYDPKSSEPNIADHFFGVDMSAKFMQSANGLDDWGHDLIFEFSGDDDFWFYVDGKLILDLGGIHSALDGSINFRTGKVVVNGKNTNLRELFKEAYLEEHLGASDSEVTKYLDGIFKENEQGVKTVFKDYSGHTMRMFYMERGAGASNLHMRFNLAPYKDGEVQLKKEVSGIEKPDSSMIFPFQVWYQNKERPDDEYENIMNRFVVKDSKTGDPIPYEATYAVGGLTYKGVYLLKPNQTVSIELPDEDTKYYICECGMDRAIYDQVTINEKETNGTSTTVAGREDFESEKDTVAERKRVIYNNHVSKSAQHSLNITKKLWEDTGMTRPIPAERDDTVFRFRICIGTDSQGNPEVYNTGKYYVKNPDGEYCINQNGKFVTTHKTNFDDLNPITPSGAWESERDMATFETSPSGIADRIPVGYTVEVPGLMAGNAFMVEEREGEIPAGYNLIGYKRKGDIPEGELANKGVIRNGDEHVIVNNQHGYGLHVEKKWSDAPFMEWHDPIYFAVYLKGSGDDLTLLDNSLLQLGKTETSLQWFFHDLAENKTLNDYLAYEVTVKNAQGEDITPDEYYDLDKDPDTGAATIPEDWKVTKVEQDGIITVNGQTNDHGYATTFDYTASYDRETLTPEQIEDGANSRTDKVSNSRPGLKLIKTDMNRNVLEGATFTLVEKNDTEGTTKKTFTSDEDGLIAVAYLTEGEEYILTETVAPYKYMSVIEPLTIKVEVDSDDGSNTVYVNDSPTAPADGNYEIKQVAHPTVAKMPAITIKNKPFKLNAVKTDLVSGVPVEGAGFELYREIKDSQTGNPMRDYRPMEGFENLQTKADGTIPKITMDDLKPGTYYLHEKSVPSQYKDVEYDVRLTIEKTGNIIIEKAEYSESEHKWVFSEINSDRAELSTDEDGNVTLTVKNTPKKIVRILKKAEKAYGDPEVLPGAEFALYTSDQIQDGKPKEGEEPVLTGTTNDNGILDLGALKDNTIYYMFETKTPTGYVGFDSPVIITVEKDVTDTKITATLDGKKLDVENLPDEEGMKVAQITLFNKAKNTLEITTTIDKYRDNGTGNDVTFVFEINGYVKDNTEPVYTKRVGMQFKKNGDRTQTITVKGIPSGLEKLMVKEVYYGDYTLVTDDENPPERQAIGPDKNGVYKVSFENELTGKTHNGGVVNKYEQDGETFKRVAPQADTNRQTHHR